MPTTADFDETFIDEPSEGNPRFPAVIALLVVGLALVLAYFVWWAPSRERPVKLGPPPQIIESPSGIAAQEINTAPTPVPQAVASPPPPAPEGPVPKEAQARQANKLGVGR